MVYIFTFAFGVSLGPISWNVCGEVFNHSPTTYLGELLTRLPDLPLPHQRQMLRHHHLHAMALPRCHCNHDALSSDMVGMGHVVSLLPHDGQGKTNDGHSLIYCGFCTLTLIWVVFYVPETRGVALGREMDKIFGLKGEEEDIVDESSALLRNEHVRKASFASLS